METEQAKQIMGRIVAALREERLMSRYALAKRAGVDCSWLRRFEQGRSGVRVETLIAIAQGLQMPAARIVDMIEIALCEAAVYPGPCAKSHAESRSDQERQRCFGPLRCKDADLY